MTIGQLIPFGRSTRCALRTAAMTPSVIAILLSAACLVHPASAEGCTKSLEYILNNAGGQLSRPANAYQKLLRTCLQIITMGNVQDAFILKDGGIAVIPRSFTAMATARTLAAICQEFPMSTLRFATKREARKWLTEPRFVVLASSNSSPSCHELRGKQ